MGTVATSDATFVGDPDARRREFLEHAAEMADWMVSRVRPGRPIGLNTTWSRGRTIKLRVVRLEPAAANGAPVERVVKATDTLRVGDLVVVTGMLGCPEFGQVAVARTVRVGDSEPEILTSATAPPWSS